MSTLRRRVGLILLAPFALIAAGAAFPVTILGPQIVSLRFFNPVRTAYMIQRLRPVSQTWVGLEAMPASLKRAVVEAEDGNFYKHHGVDYGEMKASWIKNRTKKRYARGFSTITMQLARNLYLTSHKFLVRKAFEIAIAQEMELVLPKDRILELYLNLIEWGDGIYGAEEAARHYFKKPASALTASESAFLASIIPNPRKWGQWPPGPYVAKRQAAILRRIGGGGSTPIPKKKKTAARPAPSPESRPETSPAPEPATVEPAPAPSEPIPDLPEGEAGI